MLTGIITATLVVGLTGILIGLFLGAAGIKFKVKVDEKEEAVLKALPGNNCGGCGYPAVLVWRLPLQREKRLQMPAP